MLISKCKTLFGVSMNKSPHYHFSIFSDISYLAVIRGVAVKYISYVYTYYCPVFFVIILYKFLLSIENLR